VRGLVRTRLREARIEQLNLDTALFEGRLRDPFR
jgi:hypothetical protein